MIKTSENILSAPSILDQTGDLPRATDATGTLSPIDADKLYEDGEPIDFARDVVVLKVPGTSEPAVYPPSGARYYAGHDLVAEAVSSPVHQDGENAGTTHDIIGTPLTVSDATIAIRSLRHPESTERLIRDYPEALRQRTYEKTRAIVDVNIAQSMPSTVEAYDSYERMRAGEQPRNGLMPLDSKRTEMQVFTEKPLAPVGPESLALTAEEYHVVLDGLRVMAARAEDRYERLEAMDLLSRYAQSEGERELYLNLLKGSGIRLDISPQPQYALSPDSLIQ